MCGGLVFPFCYSGESCGISLNYLRFRLVRKCRKKCESSVACLPRLLGRGSGRDLVYIDLGVEMVTPTIIRAPLKGAS